jgi:hypothetical protein
MKTKESSALAPLYGSGAACRRDNSLNGELADIRIYRGALHESQVAGVGRRR